MDDKGGWKKFHKLKFDTTTLSKRVRKAETATTRHAHKFIIGKLNSIRDARQHITLWFTVVGVLIIAVAVQMVWYQSGYKQTAPLAGGVYAEATLGPIKTLNPLYAQSMAERSVAKLVFSSLLDYDTTAHLRNDTLASMKISPDRKSYTVNLRQDVKWHDGQTMTADDVVYTVELMKDPDVRAVMRSSWLDVRVQKIDTYTVRFTLPSAHAAFPHALTFSILPKHLLDTTRRGALRESTFSISPVGSGPFKMRLLQSASAPRDHKIAHLTAWDKYYRGSPKLARFELHAYQSEAQLAAAVSSRDVNAALGVNPSDKLPADVVKEAYPTYAGVYALFNTTSPILSDKNVRQALARGIHVDQLRTKLPVASPALKGPFLAKQIDDVALPNPPAYDKKYAGQLLRRSGWVPAGEPSIRQKQKKPLVLRLVAVDGEYNQAVSELTRQWRELGVDVQVTKINSSEGTNDFVQTILRPRNYDVLVTKLDIGADPDVFAYWHSSQANATGLNFSNYQNPTSDDALLSARLRSEPELRAQKYRAFTKQWYSDAPALGLYQATDMYVHTKMTRAMTDQQVLSNYVDRFSNILYWTAEQGQVYKTP